MPEYHYKSPDNILLKDVDQNKITGKTIFIENPDDLESCRLIWVEKHGISEDPIIPCPITGKRAIRTMVGYDQTWYIRGNGLARDVAGARRDMNLYQLQQNDPYAHMRQPGEKDDLINRLKKGGKHNPKTQYFTA